MEGGIASRLYQGLHRHCGTPDIPGNPLSYWRLNRQRGATRALRRIANFINGELWGGQRRCSWGFLFPPGFEGARHPHNFTQRRSKDYYLCLRSMAFVKSDESGEISGEFLIVYAIARI